MNTCLSCHHNLNETNYLCPNCGAINHELSKNLSLETQKILTLAGPDVGVLNHTLRDEIKKQKKETLIVAVILGFIIIILYAATR
ncbi:hypothetical protein KAR91_27625 [Candidatus Pacearchaeota archaeon]|nr:hypothetical protein [Candidatus Pacearchaeota archaeon]